MNWDYIAGLFDGEGSIGIRNPVGNSRGRGIQLMIGVTHKETITKVTEFLKSEGITRNGYKEQPTRTGKIVYIWQVSNKYDAKIFLEKVRGKVIIKREKANQALEFIAGLKTFTRPFYHKELELIKKLTIDGKTANEMGKLLGCCSTKILRARKILGIAGYHALYHKNRREYGR